MLDSIFGDVMSSSPLLVVENLRVSVGDRLVLNGVNLSIGRGEFHILLGPNGVGKSTLINVIMGIGAYKIVSGKILFNNVDITNLPPYERAKMGISVAFQYPPKFDGLKLDRIVFEIRNRFGVNSDFGLDFGIEYLYNRDLFSGFSGGEKKKVETFLALLQSPKLLILDEPDSGVDVENIKVIANAINLAYSKGVSILLVTHQGFILNYLKNVDIAHVMVNGAIIHSGDPKEIVPIVLSLGYKKGLEKLIGVNDDG